MYLTESDARPIRIHVRLRMCGLLNATDVLASYSLFAFVDSWTGWNDIMMAIMVGCRDALDWSILLSTYSNRTDLKIQVLQKKKKKRKTSTGISYLCAKKKNMNSLFNNCNFGYLII